MEHDPSPTLEHDRDVLSLAMRAGKMGAWSRDLTHETNWLSPELESIAGLEPGAADRNPDLLTELIHPDDRAKVAGTIESAIQAREDYSVEFRFRHASGEWRWMEVRGRAAYDAHGPAMVYGIATDVTDRKLAEREHAHLAAIVASSNDAIISKTLEGVITSWNAAAERMFGYTSAEAVGQPVTLIIPSERRDEERRILERLSAGERVEHFETVRRTRDGSSIEVSLTISPIRDARGRIIGASKVARDISERRRNETEREQILAREQSARARAEEASRLKDEFLATVSHELRTPLNAIMGWTRMLREGVLDENKAAYAAEVVERNARTQAQLIEDLLDVSSIVTGKLRLNVRAVMPATVVESAINSVRPMADAKEIRVHSMLDASAGPLSGDSARLQQVIWNLLSNAIKFTPRGGRVEVRLERVASHLELIVSDTGQGISPEFLPHVFDRFRQADASSTRRYGGLGLGLAIVRHIVELHGGTVSASSPGLGQGAMFTVQMPLQPVRPRMHDEPRTHPAIDISPPPSLATAPRLDGVRVLVADDEPATRSLLREVLEQRGAQVHDAGTARQAFDEVIEWKPDLLLSDIGMPGEDGYDLIRKVREWEKTERIRIPAVALTAYARTEDRMRALLAGYQIHVAKPIDPMELVLVVASLVTALPARSAQT